MRPEEQDVARGGDSRWLALFCTARVDSFLFTSCSAALPLLRSDWSMPPYELVAAAAAGGHANRPGAPMGSGTWDSLRQAGSITRWVLTRRGWTNSRPSRDGGRDEKRVCSAPVDCNQGKRASHAQAQSPWRLSVLDRIFRNRRESSHPPAGGRELP